MQTVRFVALALILNAGCYHKDGTPYTGPEIFKFTRDAALTACAVNSAAGTIVFHSYPLAKVTIDLICAVVRAFPEAIGVVATADGHVDPIGRISSGGER